MPKKIQVAGGVGESKVFCAPEAERPVTGVDRILACHIDGKPVKDMGLDPQILCAIDYYSTDEGIKERENAPMARESSGITQGAGPFEKALQERRDDVLNRGKALFDARDPLKETADRYAKPGMRPKFLSAARIKDEGGTGIHELVKDEKGEPIKVKGMLLAHCPVEVVQARDKHYRARGNDLLKQITESHQAQGGSVDAGSTTRV